MTAQMKKLKENIPFESHAFKINFVKFHHNQSIPAISV